MFWLLIFDNPILHLVAETLVIVVGSMLLGILLAYFHWGGYKKEVAAMNNRLDFEKNQVTDLIDQVKQLTAIRAHLTSEISDERNKNAAQAKTIFDQQHHLFSNEAQIKKYKNLVDELNAAIESFQQRIQVIEEELNHAKNPVSSRKKAPAAAITRANYEHVSQLLGKTVTENDLTLITGIGPRTASLLQEAGIANWEQLGNTSVERLRELLNKAGGIYKTLDPTHWPKQSVMAAQSEWRKLRVYQETLKKIE